MIKDKEKSRAYQNDWYHQNKPERAESTRRRTQKRRQFVNLLKAERGCYDCGGMFPPVALDWDHVRGEKLFTIGAEQGHRPLDAVIAEIEKCDLVCANCHRVRTANRKRKFL